MTTAASESRTAEQLLAGQRVALVGKFAGIPKRETQQLVRQQGGVVVEQPDAATTLLVVGERELPLDGPLEDAFDPPVREAVERGTLEILSEAQFWQRLNLVDIEQHIHSLYTPAMLARLLGVPASRLRRWQQRGWIVPVREVRKLAYFDFQEVATARRLTELLAAGMSPSAIEKKLAELARYLPDVKRPLAQLSVIVEGKHLLVRQGSSLIEPGGQLRLDFKAGTRGEAVANDPNVAFASDLLSFNPAEQSPMASTEPTTPGEMVQLAGQMEDEGHLEAAADMYRAALAAGGPSAEICFLLAELLYQTHDLSAARERYYMAIELDEDYVEARANLGCVLSELGEHDLAIAAFRGALAFHEGYGDVHYHLGRILDEVGQGDEAATHWQAFLRLSPSSPWADEARERLGANA